MKKNLKTILMLLSFLGVFQLEVQTHAMSCAEAVLLESAFPKKGTITRETNILRLMNQHFDVIIIGGGSAGLGAALDASNRGLKVALIESGDFAAETSSRSTKLLHGGVRYLEQLVKTFMKTGKFDKTLFNLIKDALHERDTLLKIAPHLTNAIPIVTPVYSLFEIPYYMIGLKMYDALAGKRSSFPGARFISAKAMIKRYPMMNPRGLKGGVEYFDGQFNDSRMAIALAMTAQSKGAALVNHAAVTELVKNADGKVIGVKVVDRLTGQEFETHGKIVINATGPFSDNIRKMDNPDVKPMVTTSSGTHIVLSSKFVPPDSGILIPKTDDGRVLFILPWEGHTLVGTTDDIAPLRSNPQPKPEEVEYLLAQVAKYYSVQPTKEDVLAQWTGLRPLVSDPKNADTAKLARDHVVQVSDSNLVTIVGGKWTTYRKMALDVVDHALKVAGLKNLFPESQTDKLVLIGAEEYNPAIPRSLQNNYRIESDVSEYLARAYGDRASDVLSIEDGKLNVRLVEELPFLESEVLYAFRVEAARTAVDVISRRMRLTFLNKEAAMRALPRVVELLGHEQGWDQARRQQENQSARQYLGFP